MSKTKKKKKESNPVVQQWVKPPAPYKGAASLVEFEKELIMSETKHTPGPYFVASDAALDCPAHSNSGLALVDTGRENDWPIARLCEWGNAHLIAAAPDLLEALQAFVDAAPSAGASCLFCQQTVFLKVGHEEHLADCEIMVAKKAIAKAKGVKTGSL